MKKLKYKQGRRIIDMLDLQNAINYGRWIYLFDKPKHPRVLENMTFKTLRCFIRSGQLSLAELNEEEPCQNKKQ